MVIGAESDVAEGVEKKTEGDVVVIFGSTV